MKNESPCSVELLALRFDNRVLGYAVRAVLEGISPSDERGEN